MKNKHKIYDLMVEAIYHRILSLPGLAKLERELKALDESNPALKDTCDLELPEKWLKEQK